MKLSDYVAVILLTAILAAVAMFGIEGAKIATECRAKGGVPVSTMDGDRVCFKKDAEIKL